MQKWWKLGTDSDLNRRRSRKTPLTGRGAESGEISNVKVIANFETFLESINMPSSDQWFRNYGHWKLGKVSVLDRSNCPHKSEL
jgi:hypothetical protein